MNNLQPETTVQSVIGQVIVKIRKEMNFEQHQLAKAAGVNQSTWSKIERGESALSIEKLMQVAGFMQIKPSIIIIQAESVISQLKSQGVIVKNRAPSNGTSRGAAIIGAAALGGLVALILKS